MSPLPTFLVVLLFAGAARADGSVLQPFGAGPEPASPWHVVGLPQQRVPLTRFSVSSPDERPVLRVETEGGYGNLVHPLRLAVPRAQLAWRWRIDRFVDAADLRTRSGDDSTLKLCVFFDEPMADVPFVERQVLRMARLRSSEPLPSATLCYVWDNRLPPGTVLANAYTRRLRYLVIQSGGEAPIGWRSERRDPVADFMRVFGDEVHEPPAIIGVAIGADGDNTRGHGSAQLADLSLDP